MALKDLALSKKRRPADKRERRFYNHRLGSAGHSNQVEVDQGRVGLLILKWVCLILSRFSQDADKHLSKNGT